MSKHSNEELLTGGNISNVYRSGNTVRRDLKPTNPMVHSLLKHLESKGYEFSPRFLGIDDQGREVLSYIEGEAGNYPLKEYMWSDETLMKVAKMLRLYHDAVSDFLFDDSWTPLDNTPLQHEIICHNDFAIYNIIFREQEPVGVIDFDVAAPGPRLWDIAYTLYTCAPLSRFYLLETGEKKRYTPSQDAERIRKRIQLFFDAYGEELKDDLVDMVILRLEGLCQLMIRKASEGDLAFQRMIEQGHLRHYQKDIQFLRERGKEWS
ncbi:phosphotransferase [Bacillus horti]|uniref:Aminoglycoside phosphotransferase domain-containing protein n=1 Tax=Caldalkalibacillus horti TaxID=77523 RepID=A0ABT9W4R0_9BACI|nr:phosphotransferase [Bacillus horti]MDQ0168220.1 hypothetical protein [Bacillus horti]